MFPRTALESALEQDYQRVFGTQIAHPAYFDNSTCGGGTVSTTAYFGQSDRKSTLLYLSTSVDGKTVVNQLRNTVVTPAGMFRILVVFVGYADVGRHQRERRAGNPRPGALPVSAPTSLVPYNPAQWSESR